MKVTLKLFAVARQLAGGPTIELEIPDGGTVGDLRRSLAAAVPAMESQLSYVLFAVGLDYADDATRIPAGVDVACIPPVSGG